MPQRAIRLTLPFLLLAACLLPVRASTGGETQQASAMSEQSLLSAMTLEGVQRVEVKTDAQQTSSPIEVRTSQSYELANIILALTSHGLNDEWEVLKDTSYHRDVIAFFEPCRNHPLLVKVNYSRDRWEEYLAFRSDAYAFEYQGDGVLQRVMPLRTSARVSPFDDNLTLIGAFAKECGFDAFYQTHAPYYASLAAAYRDAYMFPQMLAFLQREFGHASVTGRYLVVLSPLVGRMNAQRRVKEDQLSFVSPARGLLEGGADALPIRDRITEVHTLFTEINHAFVNPVSDTFRSSIDVAFDWKLWAAKSGYDSNYQAFNEYMTWAAYDVFVREQFGERSAPAISNWHLQNKSRGFIASELFAAKLEALRGNGAKTLRNAYPAMLDWAQQARASLDVPTLVSATVEKIGESYLARMNFSVPMHTPTDVVVKGILRDGDGRRPDDSSGQGEPPALVARPQVPDVRGSIAGPNVGWTDVQLVGRHGLARDERAISRTQHETALRGREGSPLSLRACQSSNQTGSAAKV
jgi:Domain of unknown function (DUF4932)